jgi:hypothetical protein
MLSKSRFLSGLQCPLSLWYLCFQSELATPFSPIQQALFDMGHEVGMLATRRFNSGVLIAEDYLHHKEAMQKTLSAMADENIKAIFEAAFIEDDIRIRVDVLERAERGKWNLIEVKSTTSVKEIHEFDVAVQYRVLRDAGLDIARVYLMHLNNQYVYDGTELVLSGLFTLSDLTAQTRSLQNEIDRKLKALKSMLGKTQPPNIAPSKHCTRPYLCRFWEHCTRGVSENWVMNLHGITHKKIDQLEAVGVTTIDEIPETFPLTQIQERQKQCIDFACDYKSDQLASQLLDVEYPLHFLDFETVAPALPRYAGTRPFQTIPFQWSHHIFGKDNTLEHQEYLCTDDKDPRAEFAQTLLSTLGETGTIFIWAPYERRIISELSERFPHLKSELDALLPRLNDLNAIIRKNYYHRNFNGSFSLKAVLPALVPDMDYAALEIQEGATASLEYLRFLNPKTPADEKENIKSNLLTYCRLDTLAMVRIREALLEKVNKKGSSPD